MSVGSTYMNVINLNQKYQKNSDSLLNMFVFSCYYTLHNTVQQLFAFMYYIVWIIVYNLGTT